MTPFDLFFALFSLLLGLGITEIFGGLGRMFEWRKQLHVGWLTPLLGVYVLLELISWWHTVWIERSHVTVNPLTLFGLTAFAGAYYFAAYITFPRALVAGSDVDDHFFEVRRVVLLLSFISTYINISLGLFVFQDLRAFDAALSGGMFLPVYAMAIFGKRTRIVGLGLGLGIVLPLLFALTWFGNPNYATPIIPPEELERTTNAIPYDAFDNMADEQTSENKSVEK